MKVNNISFLLVEENQWDEVFVNIKYDFWNGDEVMLVKKWRFWIGREKMLY
jgi:hypothetical protein